jgi:hypothetical protein
VTQIMSVKRTFITALCVASLCSLGFGQSTFAQDKVGEELEAKRARRAAEVKELEAMLKQVDSAMAKLKPLLNPKFNLVQYDVRHLLYRPDDRAAPQLSIPSNSAGYRTNKGGGGSSLSFDDESSEEEGGAIDPEKLTEIIMDLTGEEKWEDPASIEVNSGFLIVYQTKLTHARILSTLESLRKASVRSIQMEVCFYSLPAELKKSLEQAALSTKGLIDKKILAALDAAVKGKKAKMLGNAMLTALSDQRVYLHQGLEQSFVATIERSSGGTGGVIATVNDPIVKVLRTGMALDMRGTVIDRGGVKQVALDVRFLQSIQKSMRQSKTPFGTIDMPRVKTNSVRTSARVPTGQGMLIYSAKSAGDGDKEAAEDLTIIVRPRILPSR